MSGVEVKGRAEEEAGAGVQEVPQSFLARSPASETREFGTEAEQQ